MKIHIATTIDKNYVQHLGVMLASLFENNPANAFVIHIFTDFEPEAEFRKLQAFIQASHQEMVFKQLNTVKVEGLKITGHISRATYFRLLIPGFLQSVTDRILYLDSDLLVLQDLLPLWQTDLGDFPVAAVPELAFINPDNDYLIFNAGVLLLNVNFWIENDLTHKALHYAQQNADKIVYWDQDVLNYIFQKNWLPLPEKWNLLSAHFATATPITDLGIIHYTGSLKPWHYHCTHPLKNKYFMYLRKTPWKKFRLPENTFQHRLNQEIKKAVNFISGKKIFEIYA